MLNAQEGKEGNNIAFLVSVEHYVDMTEYVGGFCIVSHTWVMAQPTLLHTHPTSACLRARSTFGLVLRRVSS